MECGARRRALPPLLQGRRLLALRLLLLLAAAALAPTHAAAAGPPRRRLHAAGGPPAAHPFGSGETGGGILEGGGDGTPIPDFLRTLLRSGYEARPYHPPHIAASWPAAAARNQQQPSAQHALQQPWPAAARPPAAGNGSSAAAQQQAARARSAQLEAGAAGPGARFGYQWAAATGQADPPACARAFGTPGSRARSLAVILLKWRREYYPPRSACCPGSQDPACDCTWGGYKYDELPSASSYEHIFSDECDGFTSINRALHRMSGGQVTFESNSTRRNLGASGGVGVGAASGAAIGGRVDVYGWATLDAMRDNATHECLDWCGDAMRRLGVSPRGHQHVVCFPLYKPDQAAAGAPAVCDNACPSNGACGASCPAGDAYRGLAGCGCGTCYWAWGGQWGCGPQSGRRRHMTGFAAPTATIGRGGPVNLVEGHKVYMAHELGHNLGLTHAASLVCRVENGVINRQATACRPDWYGDVTTFMASASSLTIPAYYKVQQGWLSQHLMQTVTETGRQASYVLRDTNAPPPAAPGGEPRWAKSDVLLLRVAIDASLPAAHACPCPHGACGAAAACQRDDQCGGGPCCIDPECADGGFEFYYVEFSRSPVPRDYGGGGLSGVTIRAAGGLRNCASTRLVPTHAVYGSAQYALSTPDPLGRLPGSMFEDSVRRVAVRLDGMGPDWAQVSVLKY